LEFVNTAAALCRANEQRAVLNAERGERVENVISSSALTERLHSARRRTIGHRIRIITMANFACALWAVFALVVSVFAPVLCEAGDSFPDCSKVKNAFAALHIQHAGLVPDKMIHGKLS
jgi:hypothetical protein